MLDNITEEALLQRARTGDYDAFEMLHSSLEPAVSRFVRRLIGYGQEAEDIVQDTFIALFMHMDRIDPDSGLRPYVFRIARNRCYDLLRRAGRFEQLSLDDEPVNVRVSFDVADQVSQAPEEITHWLLLHLEVREAMDNLPELQRQALILYCEEELSYAEIAEVMDVSIGTVKSRLFHAKKNLHRLISLDTLAAINENLLSDSETEALKAAQSKLHQTDKVDAKNEAVAPLPMQNQDTVQLGA